MAVRTINSVQEFKDTIMQKSIIMIHKVGCPFCDRAKPWLRDESEQRPGVVIAMVDKEDIRPILEVFQVKMYPTFIACDEGKVLDVFYGDTVEQKVRGFIEKNS